MTALLANQGKSDEDEKKKHTLISSPTTTEGDWLSTGSTTIDKT